MVDHLLWVGFGPPSGIDEQLVTAKLLAFQASGTSLP
jgi:hypothetical protein